jgi:Domain of unknown function (DUF4187)
MTLYLR